MRFRKPDPMSFLDSFRESPRAPTRGPSLARIRFIRTLTTTRGVLTARYNVGMTRKGDHESQRTVETPVAGTAQISILTTQEQAEFIDLLEVAEARIEAGDFVDFDPEI